MSRLVEYHALRKDQALGFQMEYHSPDELKTEIKIKGENSKGTAGSRYGHSRAADCVIPPITQKSFGKCVDRNVRVDSMGNFK